MKRWSNVACLALVVGVCAAVSLVADDAKDAKKEAPAKPSRVYAPYHGIELSDEQRTQVVAIQADYRAKIEALEIERDAKIEALLNDEQLKAVRAREAERAKRIEEYRKQYNEKRKADKAEEKPAGDASN